MQDNSEAVPDPSSFRDPSEIQRHEVPPQQITDLAERRVAAWQTLEPYVESLCRRPTTPPNTSSYAWHLLDAPLEPLLATYGPLQLRPGYTIRAYLRFRRGTLAGGIAFSVADQVCVPDPWECMELSTGMGAPAPYFEGMSCFLDVLQDATDDPFEYICASLFARDVYNFAGGPVSWHDVFLKSELRQPAVVSHRRHFRDEHRMVTIRLDGRQDVPGFDERKLHIVDIYRPKVLASLHATRGPDFRTPHFPPLPYRSFVGVPRREELDNVIHVVEMPY